MPTGRSGCNAFVVDGFSSWKKVNDGKNCAFLGHIGKDPNSMHRIAVNSCNHLLNQSQHIEKVIEKQNFQ